VLGASVDRRAVGAEQAAVPVLVGERVDHRHQLVEPAVGLPRLSLQLDPLVDDLRHARGGVVFLAFVPVPEEGAQRLVVAPVAERVLLRLELARRDPFGHGRDPPA
jgi:hypothetical protein